MKAFFEEYGRVIVTVLIILGIILVGYTIAGNGQNSAFGRFTTDIVDSLTRQASGIIKDSAEYLERTAKNDKGAVPTTKSRGAASVSTSTENGIMKIAVSGKAGGKWNSEDVAFTAFYDGTPVPWGKKSVVSFDLYSDKDSSVWMDFNVDYDMKGHNEDYSYLTNDGYTNEALYMDGQKTINDRDFYPIDVPGGKWHHMIAIVENGNQSKNPDHSPYKRVYHALNFSQSSGTTKYQIKNLKYGVAD